VRKDDVSTAEVGLDVVAGEAACNQSIEVVTENVLDGVSAPAHVVTTEPSFVVIVEIPFVILILISGLTLVL
jgi:hypothetical protein